MSIEKSPAGPLSKFLIDVRARVLGKSSTAPGKRQALEDERVFVAAGVGIDKPGATDRLADSSLEPAPLLLAQAGGASAVDATRGLQPDLSGMLEVSAQPSALPAAAAMAATVATGAPAVGASGGAVSGGIGWGWWTAGGLALAGAAAGGGGGGGGSSAGSATQPADTIAPTAPSIDLLAGSDSGASATDNITGATSLSVRISFNGSGSAAPAAGDVVKLYQGSTEIGNASLNSADLSQGFVDITTSNLAAGAYSLTARITDGTGNVSAASGTMGIVIDTTAPNATALDLVVGSDTGVSDTDNLTSASTLTFAASLFGSNALAGDTVNLYIGGSLINTVNLTSTNIANGEVTITVATVPSGSSNFTATIVDMAGNTSALSANLNVVRDTAGPTVAITDDTSSTANGDVTYTFSFSEGVADFDATDITVTGASLGAFSGSGSTYTLVVTPVPLSIGNITVDVLAGRAADSSGNPNVASTQSVQPFDTTASGFTLGQASIDLGAYGKLILPVQVDGGNWYYYWDRSADGTSGNLGGLNGGNDSVAHDVLDGLFAKDQFGVTNVTENTDDTYRFGTLNGFRVALPTIGEVPLVLESYRSGTSVDNSPIGEVNFAYDDLLAVWDAFNGSGTGTQIAGVPAGWESTFYWSATPASFNAHAFIDLNDGSVSNTYDFNVANVMLQVFP